MTNKSKKTPAEEAIEEALESLGVDTNAKKEPWEIELAEKYAKQDEEIRHAQQKSLADDPVMKSVLEDRGYEYTTQVPDVEWDCILEAWSIKSKKTSQMRSEAETFLNDAASNSIGNDPVELYNERLWTNALELAQSYLIREPLGNKSAAEHIAFREVLEEIGEQKIQMARNLDNLQLHLLQFEKRKS